MRPRIRTISTVTHEDLDSFHPEDITNFETTVRLMIGAEGEEGEESFDISVCALDWLNDQCEELGYFFLRKRLIVSHWNPDLIRLFISKRISTLTAESWQDMAAKRSEFAGWEFEDYREAPIL
jgi:hypothetical protein